MLECVQSKPKIFTLIVCILVIFSTSLISVDLDIIGFEFLFEMRTHLFNLIHIPLFMVLAIIWLQIVRAYSLSAWKKISSALLFSIFISTVYELIQMAIPGRSASSMDIGYNLLGVLAGIFVCYKLERAKPSLMRRLVCQ